MNLRALAKKSTRRLEVALKRSYARVVGDRDVYYRTKYGFHIKLNLTKDVDSRFFMSSFEEETLGVFVRMLHKGFVVLDVGANIGIYTLIASGIIGPRGSVHAFEPADWSFNRLLDNVELNDAQNVISNKMGVSDQVGETTLFVCADDAYNSLGSRPMKDVVASKPIEVTTLDAYHRKHGLGRVDIIKIDAEGADYLVIAGAREIIARFSPTIFLEYNEYVGGFSHSAEELVDLLSSMGYELLCIEGGRLTRFDSGRHRNTELIAQRNRDNNSSVR